MKLIIPIALIMLASCAKQEQVTTTDAPVVSTATTDASPAAPAVTAAAAMHEQTIQVGGAFTPSSIKIPANQPVRLNFHRTAEPSCADEIMFPSLNMKKKIAVNETVSFDLPPQKAGTLNFACGMDMIKGTAVVQ